MTGTYTLQTNKAAFNQYRVDPTCQLCLLSPETPTHFIAECPTLSKTREKYLPTLRLIVPPSLYTSSLTNSQTLTKLTIDPTSMYELFPNSSVSIEELEIWARQLIYALHTKRAFILGLNTDPNKTKNQKTNN